MGTTTKIARPMSAGKCASEVEGVRRYWTFLCILLIGDAFWFEVASINRWRHACVQRSMIQYKISTKQTNDTIVVHAPNAAQQPSKSHYPKLRFREPFPETHLPHLFDSLLHRGPIHSATM